MRINTHAITRVLSVLLAGLLLLVGFGGCSKGKPGVTLAKRGEASSTEAPSKDARPNDDALSGEALEAVNYLIVRNAQVAVRESNPTLQLSADLKSMMDKYEGKEGIDVESDGVVNQPLAVGEKSTITRNGKLVGQLSGALNVEVTISNGEVGVLNGRIYVGNGTVASIGGETYKFSDGRWTKQEE